MAEPSQGLEDELVEQLAGRLMVVSSNSLIPAAAWGGLADFARDHWLVIARECLRQMIWVQRMEWKRHYGLVMSHDEIPSVTLAPADFKP